jgi:hypothetical protein
MRSICPASTYTNVIKNEQATVSCTTLQMPPPAIDFLQKAIDNGYNVKTIVRVEQNCIYTPNIKNIPAAIAAPASGPTIGTQAYFQSLSRFPGIGRKKCIIRGPRSRAGLIA